MTRSISAAIAGLALFAAACSSGVPATTTSAAPTTSTTTLAVAAASSPATATVEAWGAENDVIGATVLIVAGDGSTEEIAYGFADREAAVPTRPGDHYRIGSITKIYTAATVMSLFEDGALDLAQPAADFVPSLPPEVTVEQLLSHTSGLRDVDVAAGIVEAIQNGLVPDASVDPVLQAVERGLVFSPGTQQRYSNIGYLALGQVIEAASGRSYSAALAEHLPLSTGTTGLEDEGARLPTGYERFGPGAPPISLAEIPTTGLARGAGAAGALVATAADVAGFVRALFDGDIVSDSSLRQMMDTSPPRDAYGLGLSNYAVAGADIYGHNGRTIGFAASVRHDPATDTTVVVLSNDGWAPADELAEQLLAAELAGS